MCAPFAIPPAATTGTVFASSHKKNYLNSTLHLLHIHAHIIEEGLVETINAD
jgi:hypothetical protein